VRLGTWDNEVIPIQDRQDAKRLGGVLTCSSLQLSVGKVANLAKSFQYIQVWPVVRTVQSDVGQRRSLSIVRVGPNSSSTTC